MTMICSFLLAMLFVANVQCQRYIQTMIEWNQLEFGFPTERDRQRAHSSGNLAPENATPIDVDVHYAPNGTPRIFTTIPKFVTGMPYTLATVSGERATNGPLLQPYPSYEWHNSNGDNCDQITSAFRVAINECHQMWVIDSGVIATEQRCPPQLLLFDLNTDQLVHRYRFENNTYMPRASLFITPLVVVNNPPPSGNCERSMIYVADVSYHGLVVYDYHAKAAWRVENKFMYPDPNFGTHTIAGESFTLMDGIFAISTDKRNLYFHPLASSSEYAVPLSVLNNRANWVNGPQAMEEQFKVLGGRKSECAASAMDSRGNLYCVTLNPIKLIVWNVNKPYGTRTFGVVPANPSELQFVSGMKVLRNPSNQEELWMLSNRFQKIAAGTINPSEPNFRILRRVLDDLHSGLGPDINNDLSDKLIFQ